MTKIAILPETTESGQITYRAISGGQQSVGKTAGEALDALASFLNGDDSATLVIVQRQRPDPFFTAEQHARLQELMRRWRISRDGGPALSEPEQTELEELIDGEVRASGQRTATLLREFTGAIGSSWTVDATALFPEDLIRTFNLHTARDQKSAVSGQHQ